MDSGANLTFQYLRRFYDDFAALPSPIASKVTSARDLVRQHGAYYPSLHTRRVERNPDSKFKFMNVDDQYRMVVALEGHVVLFMRVGNHDETLKWGEQANLDELKARLVEDPETLRRPKDRRPAPAVAEPMFEEELTLPQIVAREEEVSDLMVGDLFGALEGYRDGKIEDWMVFLSPLQRRAVTRTMDGPGRVTGGPGTGKTVVALHRAAAFAREATEDQPVLMTSFVRTIPEVMRSLFDRLAPEAGRRVDAKGIHSIAWQLLRDRAMEVTASPEAAKERFDRAMDREWQAANRLRRGGFHSGYVWDEIRRVIAGRGLNSVDEYLGIQRYGRRVPMNADYRRAVWAVYESYMAFCREASPPVVDHETLLRLASRELEERAPANAYCAVVVDEAQDITEMGVRFLTQLLDGGVRGRLLLVGDGGQRIYAGGYRLSDLGLDVRGRSSVLRLCYRSTDEIMAAVGALGRWLSLEEYGEDGLGQVEVSTTRVGARPVLHRFTTPDAEIEWLRSLLDPDDPDMDATGVLAPTNAKADALARMIREAGLGVVPLTEYHGRETPGVKVGTYKRAKGLEFKRVILPGLDTSFPWGRQDDIDNVLLQGGQLYVAMSRARDELLLSHVGEPSLYLEPLAAAVDAAES
jgi:superfamily I DNA/RNA helicase